MNVRFLASLVLIQSAIALVALGQPAVSTDLSGDKSTLLLDCQILPGAQLSLQTSDDLFTWQEAPGLWTGPVSGTLPQFEFRLQDWPAERGYLRLKEHVPPPPDRDFDRLTDAEEAQLGTDPERADSNANGVGDWEESLAAAPAARANPLSVALATSHPESPSVTVHRDDRMATLDLNFVAGDPWRFFDIGEDGRGAVGYQVAWHPVDAPQNVSSLLTSHTRVDIQPLWNEVPYVVKVTPVDRRGNLLEDRSSSGVIQGGSDLRVNQLRGEMTFFDDFNQPQGLPSELKWNSAYATPNNPQFNGLFVNKQYHAHTSTGTNSGDGTGDRAQSVHRPRTPLVMEAGETRRIVFDLDGPNVLARGIWYLDLLPEPLDLTGHSSIGTGENSGMAYPANGLRFAVSGQTLSIVAFDETGRQILIKQDKNLDWNGVELFVNVRRHWEIRLSTTSASVLIDGDEVLSTSLGEHALDPGAYHLHWNLFAYNSWKVNIPFYVVHWDNFGFDGPDAMAGKVVHNYRTQVMGTDYVDSFNNQPATVSINIPDDLRPTIGGETAQATLCFTLQRDSFSPYTHGSSDRVLVNGRAFPIPRAQTNGSVDLDDYSLVSAITPHSLRIPLGELDRDNVAPLQTGRNELRFESQSCGFHSIHIEIEYPEGAAPAYTESRELHPVPVHQHYAKPGLSVSIESIGSNGASSWREKLNDPAVFNPTVSGVVPIVVVANGAVTAQGLLEANVNHASMAGFGINPGIRELQLVVRPDGGVTPIHSETLTTRADVPAPQCLHTFSFDTTEVPNGIYEIEVTGLDGRGNRLTPNHVGAGFAAGTVAEYNGFYFPLHITVAN